MTLSSIFSPIPLGRLLEEKRCPGMRLAKSGRGPCPKAISARPFAGVGAATPG